MPAKGGTMSEEQKVKISESMKAKHLVRSPEHRAALGWSAHLRAGRVVSEETRLHMIEAQRKRRLREYELTKGDKKNDEESV